MPLPMAWTPTTSRAASPAIFSTTPSAMVVRPRVAGSPPPRLVAVFRGRHRPAARSGVCGPVLLRRLASSPYRPFRSDRLFLPTLSALARSRAGDAAGWSNDDGRLDAGGAARSSASAGCSRWAAPRGRGLDRRAGGGGGAAARGARSVPGVRLGALRIALGRPGRHARAARYRRRRARCRRGRCGSTADFAATARAEPLPATAARLRAALSRRRRSGWGWWSPRWTCG